MVVVSVSPQTRASIAAHIELEKGTQLSSQSVFRRVSTFLKSIGVNYVFDTTASGDFALLEV